MGNPNTGLGHLLAHARVLNRLDHKLESRLDPALSSHCQVAEFRHHCLILACSNATFATRLRMISQQLLDSFREEGEFGIERIEIRIAPVNRPQPEVRKQRTLSSAAVQALGRFVKHWLRPGRIFAKPNCLGVSCGASFAACPKYFGIPAADIERSGHNKY